MAEDTSTDTDLDVADAVDDTEVEPGEDIEADLDDEEDVVLVAEDVAAVDEDVEADEDEDEEETAAKAKGKGKAGEEDEDDDDEPDPDDVEEDLDTILKDRIAANDDEDDDEEDEDAPPVEVPAAEGGGRVQPKRPGEFTCQSCFLVKHPGQLADADEMLCADCV